MTKSPYFCAKRYVNSGLHIEKKCQYHHFVPKGHLEVCKFIIEKAEFTNKQKLPYLPLRRPKMVILSF